ncbi:MAG: hypothetical protein RA160_02855 [Arsenophonus sp.]|nr:MAG: hypothetical protein RA160_02855 [Arsenophonus sp.]
MSSIKHAISIIKKEKHSISKKYISHNALKVLYYLNKTSYAAYLVSSNVRDLLLEKTQRF